MLTYKTVLFLALLGSVSLYSCQKENLDEIVKAEFNTPFKLGFNEKSYLSNSNNGLSVEIKNITDQRCTEEDRCENEGSASVRFNLSNLKNAEGETTLSISKTQTADSTVITLNNASYLIKLLQVSASTNSSSALVPVATITLRQLN